MIVGQQSVIRTAEPDDADFLFRAFSTGRPCTFLLDHRRELLAPTRDELREMLGRKDMPSATLFAVEDLQGAVRGFAAMRGIHQEARYGDIALVFPDEEDYESGIGREALAYLCHLAFVQRKLNKVLAHCLDTEQACRALLTANGFESNGIQREIAYTQGAWHNLETLACYGSPT